MRIAICDDDIKELAIISTMVEQFKEVHCPTLIYEVFNSPKSLLSKVINQEFDILLLDIVMPNMTGIELAQVIRTFDKNLPIIFLTTSPEFAIASYRVHAKDYLLKPIDQHLFFDVLLNHINTSEAFLFVKTNDSVMQLPFCDIVHLEVVTRKIQISLVNGSILSASGTLAEYEGRLLSYSQFYKPHRSYIVHLQHVIKLDKDGIHTILGAVIPVPKPNFSATKNAYMNYLMT
ncbi:MAG: LytTR family DNA-binding domain-containing protein [Eubacteriales bacterium]